MENKNGLASGFYLILALTSGLEPPIMSWYTRAENIMKKWGLLPIFLKNVQNMYYVRH